MAIQRSCQGDHQGSGGYQLAGAGLGADSSEASSLCPTGCAKTIGTPALLQALSGLTCAEKQHLDHGTGGLPPSPHALYVL